MHDARYKNLFSDPKLVQQLLIGLVKEPWIQELDFSTLEKWNPSYITEDLRQQDNDLVWRIKVGKKQQTWFYLCLILEFQAKVDRNMALRVSTYVHLLYQDLIKSKAFEAEKKLPQIFPIVLYNGKR